MVMMRSAFSRKGKFGAVAQRVSVKCYRGYRKIYWLLNPKYGVSPSVLIVLGCQRSGTTAFTRCFEYDWRATVFEEDSQLTESGKDRLRLKALRHVQDIVEKCRTPLVVMKPIVESHRANELLDFMPAAKVVWIYRDFQEVADSNVRRFDSQMANLRIAVDGISDWRGEGISPAVRSTLREFLEKDLNKHEAASLFWFSRNMLFYELDLDTNDRVWLCKYGEFVKEPRLIIEQVYSMIGMASPQGDITKRIDSDSLKPNRQLSIRPEIHQLCEELQLRLDESLGRKRKRYSATSL